MKAHERRIKTELLVVKFSRSARLYVSKMDSPWRKKTICRIGLHAHPLWFFQSHQKLRGLTIKWDDSCCNFVNAERFSPAHTHLRFTSTEIGLLSNSKSFNASLDGAHRARAKEPLYNVSVFMERLPFPLRAISSWRSPHNILNLGDSDTASFHTIARLSLLAFRLGNQSIIVFCSANRITNVDIIHRVLWWKRGNLYTLKERVWIYEQQPRNLIQA